MLLPDQSSPLDGRSLISEILCGVPKANGKSCGADVARGVDDKGVGEENYAAGFGRDANFERGADFGRDASFGHGALRDVKEPSWEPWTLP
jgi:hypothetical protein